MDIHAASTAYEAWLRSHFPVVEAHLDAKHRQMAAGIFPFLRATFYRWPKLFEKACPDLAQAPALLAVGDLHIQNFGTWRDAEGRLVWGINDFDEAAEMPYTVDLVRLAASALLALQEENLGLTPVEACDTILEGYAQSLTEGGGALVLEENHGWLRDLAFAVERDPDVFWKKFSALPAAVPPAEVQSLLQGRLPPGSTDVRFSTRQAGMGSLGRPRYLALANWNGGLVAREAKAMLPSAWDWGLGRPDGPSRIGHIVERSIRCPDPGFFLAEAGGGWIIRRLAPRCGRIELGGLNRAGEERKLLKVMGYEVGNVHLGSAPAIAAVKADLAARSGHWLKKAADAMVEATRADWKDWRG